MQALIVKLGDEQEDRKKFQHLCRTIFRYLTTKRIKDLPLFKQRTGIEYSLFYDALPYPTIKDDLLQNDEFMETVLEETKKFKK
jgi:hypothetical protein